MDQAGQDFDHKRQTYGYLLTYVDDFLVVGPLNVRNAIEEEISRIWKIKVTGDINQFDGKEPRRIIDLLVNDHSLASDIRRFHHVSGGIHTRCVEDMGNVRL